jgi:hypothetical protein
MTRPHKSSVSPVTARQVATLVRRSLKEGSAVVIDGLGTFRPDEKGGIEFKPSNQPRLFLAYVAEDRAVAERLRSALVTRGLETWMDTHKLMPGQDWQRAAERAIELADFFVPLFSKRAVSKRGRFQSELRYALACATSLPLDSTYIVPVRLEECVVPSAITRSVQYVDLFPDWRAGLERLFATLSPLPFSLS